MTNTEFLSLKVGDFVLYTDETPNDDWKNTLSVVVYKTDRYFEIMLIKNIGKYRSERYEFGNAGLYLKVIK